ncbi:hypothetical protein [Nitrosomonas sp.]|uniref:hypothetical protein n=1 Tax=Nitrosomonas sp. TaxID=42353 RepID=UPI0025D15D17|nr:hypothetical protein [Nitrosomonas sp.]MBY0483478.1 hypothetical protein [Nitrosomonas sp.]
MTEGISKEYLENSIKTITEVSGIDETSRSLMLIVFNDLLKRCYELDPWIPIDENTPRNQDILITDKSKRKYIGRLFSSGIWCTQGKLDFIPTHYKLLQEDPKEKI